MFSSHTHSQDLTANQVAVRLAEHDLAITFETDVVSRSVSSIIPHPNYQAGTEENDIALLKLSSPVEVS